MIKNKEARAVQLFAATDGRVAMASVPNNLTSPAVFYCHGCREFFWQYLRSLLDGYRSRCKCNYDHPAPPGDWTKWRNRTGHRCLQEWEVYDREVPQKNPDVQSEGQEGVV